MELNELGLTAAAQGIRKGEFTSEEYTAACLAAVARFDPAIEVWEWLDRERAIEQARAADARRQSGMALGPLHGLPIGVKDIIDTKAIPTRIGSPIFAANVPAEDATVVQRLLEAGAFVLGKTVTTEFAWAHPGKTHNPWNAGHTPGGSSSGSAAGVAAQFMPAALGSQTLGSVIRPAAYCGVVGFKPSFGLISRSGVHPFSPTLDHIGVFARCVADAALLANCLTGFDPDDPASIRGDSRPPARGRTPPLARPPRLALVHSPVWELADEQQRTAMQSAAQTLRAAGAEIREVELPAQFAQSQQAVNTIMRAEATAVFAPLQAAHPGKVSAVIDTLIAEGRAISALTYIEALRARAGMQKDMQRLFLDFDAIVTPPATGEAPESLERTGNPAFCAAWSMLGVPAINLPAGWGTHGLPLGIQLLGAYRNDQHMLRVAQWCEERLDFKRRPLPSSAL